MFNKAQLDRIESEVKALRSELRLKEQMDRIENELKIIRQEHGGATSEEARQLAGEIKTEVDQLERDQAEHQPK